MASTNRSYGMDRTRQLQVRVSEHEHERITGEAKSVGLSVSDYVRGKVLGDVSPPQAAALYSTLGEQLDGLQNAITDARRHLLDGGKE